MQSYSLVRDFQSCIGLRVMVMLFFMPALRYLYFVTFLHVVERNREHASASDSRSTAP